MKNNFFFNYLIGNIYSKPSSVSEISSQILYGEKFSIISKSKSKIGFFPGSTIGNYSPADAKNLLKKFSKILGNDKPLTKRAGSVLASINLDKEKTNLEKKYGEKISNQQLT